MVKRIRCPCCGMLVWPSQIKKSYTIDVKDMVSLGRGRGFKFNDSEDLGLVALVKAKIKALYNRFFEVEDVTIKTVPSIRSSPGFVFVPAPIMVKPRVLIMPVVR